MILSKNTETDHGLGEQTWGSQRGRRREWDGRAFGGFLDANCYTWNGWAMGPYCTVQGNACDQVTLLSTELEEASSTNDTLIKTQ